MSNKLERFTNGARLILLLAQYAAETRKSSLIEPHHILLALTQVRRSDAAALLLQAGVTSEIVQAQINAEPANPLDNPKDIPLSPTLKRTLELSVDEAQHAGQIKIGTVNLLLGVIRTHTIPVQAVFRQAKVDEDALMRAARQTLVGKPATSAALETPKKDLGYYFWRILGVGQVPFQQADTLDIGLSHAKEEDLLDTYTDLLQIYPNQAWIVRQHANALFWKRRFEEAAVDYSALIRLNAADDSAFRNRAACSLNLKQLDAALTDINEAIRLRADEDYYEIRGRIYCAKSNYEDALKEFDAMLQRVSTNADAYAWRADVFLENLDYERAAQDCEEAMKFSQPDTEAYLWAQILRGYIALDHQNFAAAHSDFLQVNHVKPDLPSSWCGLATLNLRQGDFAEALRFAAETQKRYLNSGEADYIRAAALAAQGDIQGAVEAYRHALKNWTSIYSKRRSHYADEMRHYIEAHGGSSST
ncbi:MAG: tetratricopeptide repeat protein [Chloroflexota bacterium]